jgi:hypothetical protein
MTDLTLELLRAELAPIHDRLNKVEAYVNGVPVIGEAIAVLQRDVRLMRAAINDMGKTNITAGEVEAMHTDIDRALALAALEQSRERS